MSKPILLVYMIAVEAISDSGRPIEDSVEIDHPCTIEEAEEFTGKLRKLVQRSYEEKRGGFLSIGDTVINLDKTVSVRLYVKRKPL